MVIGKLILNMHGLCIVTGRDIKSEPQYFECVHDVKMA